MTEDIKWQIPRMQLAPQLYWNNSRHGKIQHGSGSAESRGKQKGTETAGGFPADEPSEFVRDPLYDDVNKGLIHKVKWEQ